jgi:hypothetical protein
VFLQQRTRRRAELLLIGAILAPGKRTVTSLLRIAQPGAVLRQLPSRAQPHCLGCPRSSPPAAGSLDRRLRRGSVRRVLQKPALAGGHGMLVMFDVTDLTKVARHDREGWYEGIR